MQKSQGVQRMNHLVFLDAKSGELEKVLSGLKHMLVFEADPSQPAEASMSPGDALFFLRDNDECVVRVRASLVRAWTIEAEPGEDLARDLKELQPGLQLTEEQYNHWSTQKAAAFIEFEEAAKI